MAHTLRSKNKEKKCSQSHPCWVVEALSVLRRCVSDVLWNIPIEKSCDALSDPKVQARDSWTLGRVGHLLSSREDSVEEGESLLFCLWGLNLFVTKLLHQFDKFWPQKVLFCIQCISWNVSQLRIIKTVALNCRGQFRCIYIGSADFCWISLVWLDWTHTNDIKLS